MTRARRSRKADRAPRPDARAVLAVGRRQDDAVAPLLKADRHVELSVSVTTRPQRPRRDRRARLSFHRRRPRFERWSKAGEFLEWAEVFGHRYGTPRMPVEEALRAGRDVLFDIDWQGTQQLREKARDDLVSVFILPPSSHGAGATARAPRAG